MSRPFGKIFYLIVHVNILPDKKISRMEYFKVYWSKGDLEQNTLFGVDVSCKYQYCLYVINTPNSGYLIAI